VGVENLASRAAVAHARGRVRECRREQVAAARVGLELNVEHKALAVGIAHAADRRLPGQRGEAVARARVKGVR
jgi:hypothetical protein